MLISREALIRIAKETAEKSALSDPDLVAAFLDQEQQFIAIGQHHAEPAASRAAN